MKDLEVLLRNLIPRTESERWLTRDKGAISEEERTQGYEFIWCKGFSKEYITCMKEDFNLDILCSGL